MFPATGGINPTSSKSGNRGGHCSKGDINIFEISMPVEFLFNF